MYATNRRRVWGSCFACLLVIWASSGLARLAAKDGGSHPRAEAQTEDAREVDAGEETERAAKKKPEALRGFFAELLREGIEDATSELRGDDKGRIESVAVVKREPQMLVLEVTYSGVRRSEDVSLRAEILAKGHRLPGFQYPAAVLEAGDGVAQLQIECTRTPDEFGTALKTDAVRVRFYRGNNAKGFGGRTFPLVHRWLSEEDARDESELKDGEAAESGPTPEEAEEPESEKGETAEPERPDEHLGQEKAEEVAPKAKTSSPFSIRLPDLSKIKKSLSPATEKKPVVPPPKKGTSKSQSKGPKPSPK